MLQQLKQTTTAWNESFLFLSTTIEHRAPARKPDRKGDNVSPSSIPEKGACQSKWSQKQVPFLTFFECILKAIGPKYSRSLTTKRLIFQSNCEL